MRNDARILLPRLIPFRVFAGEIVFPTYYRDAPLHPLRGPEPFFIGTVGDERNDFVVARLDVQYHPFYSTR